MSQFQKCMASLSSPREHLFRRIRKVNIFQEEKDPERQCHRGKHFFPNLKFSFSVLWLILLDRLQFYKQSTTPPHSSFARSISRFLSSQKWAWNGTLELQLTSLNHLEQGLLKKCNIKCKIFFMVSNVFTIYNVFTMQ